MGVVLPIIGALASAFTIGQTIDTMTKGTPPTPAAPAINEPEPTPTPTTDTSKTARSDLLRRQGAKFGASSTNLVKQQMASALIPKSSLATGGVKSNNLGGS